MWNVPQVYISVAYMCSEGDCTIATWGHSGGKWMNVPPKSIVVALVAVAGAR